MRRLIFNSFVLVGLIILFSSCAKTRVAVIDDDIVGHDNIHIVIISDEVDDPFDVGNELRDKIEEYGVSAEVEADRETTYQFGSGTGFVVEKNLWLTNNHVVKDLESITVSVIGKDIPADIIATDSQLDLALIRANSAGLNPIEIGTAEMGKTIFVVGFPLPSMLGSHARVTAGVVSSLHGFRGVASNIQISAPIQPGNSGGPVVDENWKLSGVVASSASTVATVSRTGVLPQGLNFAISPNIVRGWLLQNHVQFQGPYAASLSDVIASTCLIWNGDITKTKRILLALFTYTTHWDMGDHLRSLNLKLLDAASGEVVMKASTRSQSSGFDYPVGKTVEDIMTSLKIEKPDN